MKNRNLKTRQQLKEDYYKAYQNSANDCGGIIIYFFKKDSSSNFFECSVDTIAIQSRLTEKEFYNEFLKIEGQKEFICLIGEDHPFIWEVDEKQKSKKDQEIIEKNKKLL